MVESILGARIRERRRQMGVTQAEMARRIGISASYLNLIERNRRRIGGALLQRTATELGVTVDELGAANERRLAEDLAELAATPGLSRLRAEINRAGEFVGQFPGWARVVAALAQSERAAESKARALAERLNHDPFLGETVHRMLTRTAAVRSAAEILDEYTDMSDDERTHFGSIILDESRALSEASEALTQYFDGMEAPERQLTPQDEVDALFRSQRNHFAVIEEAATGLRVENDLGGQKERLAAACDLALAKLSTTIETYLAEQLQVQTAAGRARAARGLIDYAARAILMPAGPFSALAKHARYDAELLADRFNVSLADVFRRLPALPPSQDHPAFGHVRANASGSLLEVQGIEGLLAPRHAPPCPLWILFSAQASPARILRQRAVFTNGEAFIFVAKAHAIGDVRFGAYQHCLTDMLVLPASEAAGTVYGDGPEPQSEDVGPACRLCARTICSHRVEDPFLD